MASPWIRFVGLRLSTLAFTPAESPVSHATRMRAAHWTRDEAVAGLWAYTQTYGQPVSRLPGSPVATVALKIGRAVSGVYAKVINFRSLDPRAEGQGMSGAGETDRAVWREFYDAVSSILRSEALSHEFARLWGAVSDGVARLELAATAANVADEAIRLEGQSLDQLLTKYATANAQQPRRPSTRVLSSRAYERNPLVIATPDCGQRTNSKCRTVFIQPSKLPRASTLADQLLRDSSHAPGRPLSDMTFTKIIELMGYLVDTGPLKEEKARGLVPPFAHRLDDPRPSLLAPRSAPDMF